MSNYPYAFDDSTTLPPAFGGDSPSSARYTCQIPASGVGSLVNSQDSLPFKMDSGKKYLLRLNCVVVNTSTKAMLATYLGNIYAYYGAPSADVVVYNSTFGVNFSLAASVNPSNQIVIAITNNTTNLVTASAIVDYVLV